MKNYNSEDIEKIELDEDINSNTTKRTSWFSIPSELLGDMDYLMKVKKFSIHYFSFHCYLKTKMLANEKYYVSEDSIDIIINLYCASFEADAQEIKDIYEDLLRTERIKRLSPSCFQGFIITDDDIIDNYLLAQRSRVHNRKKAQNRAARKTEVPIEPLHLAEDDAPSIEDAFNNLMEEHIVKASDKNIYIENKESAAFF